MKTKKLFKSLVIILLIMSSSSYALDKSQKSSINNVNIGIAFGGGAAKALTFIGVIRAFEENNIHPKIIVGTSSGSIVGSLYAYGYNSYQIEAIVDQLGKFHLTDFAFSSEGFLTGKSIERVINHAIDNTQLQNFPKKFIVVATDLSSGKATGFNYGNAGLAIRASCSIPGVFVPVRIGNHDYVDGVLSAQVPVEIAKKAGANFIIAVDITDKLKTGEYGYWDLFERSFDILNSNALQKQLSLADVLISPDVSSISKMSFNTKARAIQLGYEATMKQMPRIKERLEMLQSQNGLRKVIYADSPSGVSMSMGGSEPYEVHAGDGDNVLYGGDSHDSFWQGKGKSYMNGGKGDDSYYFDLGHGEDTIEDYYGSNKLIFGSGITDIDLVRSKQRTNYILLNSRTHDKITIKNFQNTESNNFTLIFDNGQKLRLN